MKALTVDYVKLVGNQADFGRMAKTIGLATLVSGTLDALAAIIVFVFVLGQANVIQVLQTIASGVYGAEAFQMGLIGAFYGFVLHYIIAFGCSVVVYATYRLFPVFRDYPIASGLAYGGYVWVFMNFFVLPMTNVVQGPFSPGVALTGFIWHMFLVGLPIVLITRKGIESTN